ncbi:hypothetical protein WP1_183 [Pseudomonas phage WP1]
MIRSWTDQLFSVCPMPPCIPAASRRKTDRRHKPCAVAVYSSGRSRKQPAFRHKREQDMRFAVWDTETTGLPFHQRVSLRKQPESLNSPESSPMARRFWMKSSSPATLGL